MIEFSRIRFGLVFAVVFCVLLSGCKISGNVRDNGVGLQGITVTLTGKPDRPTNIDHLITTTDSRGYFEFDEIPDGDYIVTPSKEGMIFEPPQRKVFLTNKEPEENLTFEAIKSSGPMNFYYGNLHSHSSYSDGEGTAAQAFAWARDKAGLDFYAITDHAFMLVHDTNIDFNLVDEWADVKRQADIFSQQDVFVGIIGFEWSHPLLGHVCVYGTEDYTTFLLTGDMYWFYRWLAERPEALAQFNHPGREPLKFNCFALETDVQDNMCALETGNKDVGNNDEEYLNYYHEVLDKGWKVAPTSNQDNHSLATNSHRTVVIARELSRDGISEAMRSRRMYSSDDPNIKITYHYQDKWMGSEIAVDAAAVTLTINIEDDEPITKVQLITNGGRIIQEITPAAGQTAVSWNPTVMLGGTECYFYVQVTEQNELDDDEGNTEQIAVSAPLWFTPI